MDPTYAKQALDFFQTIIYNTRLTFDNFHYHLNIFFYFPIS